MLRNYYETDYIHTLRDLLERSEKKYGLDFAYKELDPERYRFTIYTLGLRESGAEEEDIHYLANRPELIRAFEKIVKKYENLN